MSVAGSAVQGRSPLTRSMEDSDTEDEELDEETIARERAAMRAAIGTGPQEAAPTPTAKACEKADADGVAPVESPAATAAQHLAQQQALALTLTLTLTLALALALTLANPNPNPSPMLTLGVAPAGPVR